MVTKKLRLRNAKLAFGLIDDEPVLCQALEQDLQIFEMLFGVSDGHQDVVDEGEAKRQHTGDAVDEPLKCLGSVTKAKWHPDILEQTKKCDDGCFLYDGCLHGNLVVCFDQISL